MYYTRISKFIWLCALLSIVMFAAGCDRRHVGGSGGGSEEVVLEEGHVAGAIIDNSGGSLEVVDSKYEIVGAKVVVPEGAVDPGRRIAVYIDYGSDLPAAVGDGVSQASKVVILSKSTDDKFLLPVTVTVPFDSSQMEPGDVLCVFGFDETSGKYFAVGVRNIDTENSTVTFDTIDFARYVVLSMKGLKYTDPVIRPADGFTGFVPNVDGFFHPNFGSYDLPGGSSIGMASYSQWYYAMKKAEDGNGLYGKYLEGNPAGFADDVAARELISRAFISANSAWGSILSQTTYSLNAEQTGKLFILAMMITQAPQTMVLTGENFAQAVTVYDFDATSGTFLVYDNNFPGEIVTLKWDQALGFSDYSKAAAYPAITGYRFDAFSTLFALGEFGALYEGAEGGWDISKFQTINVTVPTLDGNDTAIVNDANNVTISGTVTAGLKAARYLVYNVNGTDGLAGQLVTLGAGGSFSFTIPNLPAAKNSVMMMTTDDPRDALRRVPLSYAGFKEIIIKVQGQEFFQNIGFETGDFTGWETETHQWFYNGTQYPDVEEPGTFTPEKSGIESILGITDPEDLQDPIYSGLQRVYQGNYSGRVNNGDWDCHVSSFTQTATVPMGVANPELRFAWAAVLQDPGHDWWDQPYVDISVIDEITGETLYSKHFYSNDPAYSGWQTVEVSTWDKWQVIPWQTVVIPCAAAKGHDITLKVEAADCSQSGHGGYAYLDSAE